MKRIIVLFLVFIILGGCAHASYEGKKTWVDVAARKYLKSGQIYLGMSEEEFLELMKPSPSIEKELIGKIKVYRWRSYWVRPIEFWFEDSKLISWEYF